MAGEIDWAPLVHSLAATNWTAVLIALVTSCTTMLGPFLLWKKQGQRERESVRAALFAEVAALVEIVDRRGFLSALRERERILTERQSSPMQMFQGDQGSESYEVAIDSQYSRIYQGSVSRLGVLTAEEARQIVRFHQLADAVRQEVIPGGTLAEGTSDPGAFKENADFLEEALQIGRSLTAPKTRRKCRTSEVKK